MCCYALLIRDSHIVVVRVIAIEAAFYVDLHGQRGRKGVKFEKNREIFYLGTLR